MDFNNQKVTFSSRMKPTLKNKILQEAADRNLTPSHYLESLVESIFDGEQVASVLYKEQVVKAPIVPPSPPVEENLNWPVPDDNEDLPVFQEDDLPEEIESQEERPNEADSSLDLKEKFDLIVELGAKVTALEAEKRELSENLDDAIMESERFSGVDAKLMDLEAEKAELIERLELATTNREELEILEEKNDELEEENARLSERIDDATVISDKDIADLRIEVTALEAEKRELINTVDRLTLETEEFAKSVKQNEENCITLTSEEKHDYEQFMLKLEKSNPDLTRKHLLLGALGAACYNEGSFISFYYIESFLNDNPDKVPSLQPDSLTSENIDNE